MARIVVALPPSEGKHDGGRSAWDPASGRFGALLGDARADVASALAKYARRASRSALQQFFGVGGAHLERAVDVARGGFVDAPVLPARERYTGVVWEHLDLAGRDAPTRRWAARNVVVVSGLLGLVAAGDPVPDYRLKMGAKLPGIGPLTPWWRERITAAVAAELSGSTVVDLLPKEHAAAFDPAATGRAPVLVRFLAASGASAAGHGAKAAKGIVARAIVEGRAGGVATACAEVAAPGYVFAGVSLRDDAQVIEFRAESERRP